jgi:hypothetical protein
MLAEQNLIGDHSMHAMTLGYHASGGPGVNRRSFSNKTNLAFTTTATHAVHFCSAVRPGYSIFFWHI